MQDEEDEPEALKLADRSLCRRLLNNRRFARSLRHQKARDQVRWWSRATPLWPPTVAVWNGPFRDRPRRHRRRPTLR